MRQIACAVALLILGLSPARDAHARQPVARTTTAGVLIDVNVLDRDGKPVLDLGPADFELTEGGKRQQILAATLVNDGTSAPATATNGAAQSPPVALDQPAADGRAVIPPVRLTVTAILFDRMSPEVRPFAREAALSYPLHAAARS